MQAVINTVDYTSDIDVDNEGYSIRHIPRTSGEAFTSTTGEDYDNKVGYKAALSLMFYAMEEARISELLSTLVREKYVTLTYDDPMLGNGRTVEAKLSEISTAIVLHNVNGTDYWSGLAITLTER